MFKLNLIALVMLCVYLLVVTQAETSSVELTSRRRPRRSHRKKRRRSRHGDMCCGVTGILSSTAGEFTNPIEADVEVTCGPLTLPVEVTVGEPDEVALDLVLLIDTSGSFGDDLPVISGLVPNLVDDVEAEFPDTFFGLATFTDKPFLPFGFTGDVVYDNALTLTSLVAYEPLQTAVDGLGIMSGGDGEEAQLEGLWHAASRTTETGWRPGSTRVVVLSTDNGYHTAGDCLGAGCTSVFNEDTIVDALEDYPSVDQVRSALEAAGVFPVFAVTSGEILTYEGLVDEIGFGAVVEVSSDSTDLIEAILEGLEEAMQTVSLDVCSGDTSGIATVLDPKMFEDVMPGDMVSFVVELDPTGATLPLDDDITLCGVGTEDVLLHVSAKDCGAHGGTV